MRTTANLCLVSFLCFLSATVGLKCYYCSGKCQNPLQTQDCRTLGPGDWKCVMDKVLKENNNYGVDVDFRQCILVTDQMIADCARGDAKEGSWCKICDTDLCNLEYGPDRSSAQSVFHAFNVLFLTTLIKFIV